MGGLLAKRALGEMKRKIDWREIGGAPLVGVDGVGFITHGRSDALAMKNAVRRVRAAADAQATDEIARAAALAEALLAADATPPQHARATLAPPEA
jgi:glycerol-3-phosphate acyltransferase PlsX